MNNNKLIAGTVRRFKWRLMSALFTACCLGVGSSIAQAVEVKITFKADKCPDFVNVKEAQVENNGVDKVVWTAFDTSGAAYTEGYSIYFDPFRGGRPLKTTGTSNKITSQPVDNKVPTNTIFKYSVIGDECASPALDPHIRVF